jgi:hypothetical protein
MSAVGHYGIFVLALVFGAGVLWSAIRTDVRRLPGPRSYWLSLGLPIIWTGDALVGENRSWFERVVKGAVAIAVWVSVGIVVWRRRRHAASRPAGRDKSEAAQGDPGLG